MPPIGPNTQHFEATEPWNVKVLVWGLIWQNIPSLFVLMALSSPFSDVEIDSKRTGPNCVCSYNGSEVPQGIWHKSGSQMNFLSLAGSGPKVGPKWVSVPFSRNQPRNPLWTHFWPLSANDENPFLTQFGAKRIVCRFWALALRDLRPIISL